MSENKEISKISTGQDNTLETWINLSAATFGPESRPTKFLEEKAANAKEGIKSEVVAAEGQLLLMLGKMFVDEVNERVKKLYPFEAYNEQEKYLIEKPECFAEAIYDTWSHEDELLNSEGKPLFSSAESIENNIEWLYPYGLGIKEEGKYYKIYSLITNEVFTPEWQKG